MVVEDVKKKFGEWVDKYDSNSDDYSTFRLQQNSNGPKMSQPPASANTSEWAGVLYDLTYLTCVFVVSIFAIHFLLEIVHFFRDQLRRKVGHNAANRKVLFEPVFREESASWPTGAALAFTYPNDNRDGIYN